MARLTYYLKEGSVHGTNGAIGLSNIEARYVFQRLKRHYRLNQNLVFWGDDGRGSCSNWMVKVDNSPELKTLVHEVAHAIQFKKRKHNEKWHTKKHERIMKRIYRYALPKLDGWKAMANKKHESHIKSVIAKSNKAKELQEFRKTPQYRLRMIEKRIRLWESKRKRAENSLKKLERRRKLWQRKLSQPSSSQHLSSRQALSEDM